MSIPITLDFSLRQGDFALEISERIEARVVALFGPSGAGKTSTLESIAGLRTPQRGVIRIGSTTLFDSEAAVDVPPHDRQVGYVPQDLALFPHMNVRRNLLYGAKSGGGDGVEQVLGLLELGPMLDRDVTSLSGGEPSGSPGSRVDGVAGPATPRRAAGRPRYRFASAHPAVSRAHPG